MADYILIVITCETGKHILTGIKKKLIVKLWKATAIMDALTFRSSCIYSSSRLHLRLAVGQWCARCWSVLRAVAGLCIAG